MPKFKINVTTCWTVEVDATDEADALDWADGLRVDTLTASFYPDNSLEPTPLPACPVDVLGWTTYDCDICDED